MQSKIKSEKAERISDREIERPEIDRNTKENSEPENTRKKN